MKVQCYYVHVQGRQNNLKYSVSNLQYTYEKDLNS